MFTRTRGVFLSLLLNASATACERQSAALKAPELTPLIVERIDAGTLTLPNRLTSVKFAVIGDTGRGSLPQHELAAQMVRFREQFPFAFVLMLGDNIYEGPARPEDYVSKFEEPYKTLLDASVKFYAVLGNHDDPLEVNYALFNMDAERYYSFAPPEDVLARISNRVEFFALDSTNLDREQLRWLDDRLARSKATWKVAFFHHPLYTSGRYNLRSRWYRWMLEPVLVQRGVDAAFSGHEHFYQRLEIERGIQYFISGGGGSTRRGEGTPASYVARTFSDDLHFMLVEIDGRSLHFQAISRTGQTVDAGTLTKEEP